MPRLAEIKLTPQPDGGFFAESLAIPGVYAIGDTEREALIRLRRAIRMAVQDIEAHGRPMPEPVALD